MNRRLSRRDFLKSGGVLIAAAAAAACNLPTKFPNASAGTGEGTPFSPDFQSTPTVTFPTAQAPVVTRPEYAEIEVAEGWHPQLAAEEMADVLLGTGKWYQANNFSAYRVYVKNNQKAPDLSVPGKIGITDPTGEEAKDHTSIDLNAHTFTALLVPNYGQMPAEMAQVRTQPEREGHDSHFMWFQGNGQIELTYFWGDGTKSIITGRIDGTTFTGTVDGQEIELPAAFQTAFFDQSIEPRLPQQFKAVPAAIVVRALVDEKDYLQLETGPSSCYDHDGPDGNKDYQDAGFCFAQ